MQPPSSSDVLPWSLSITNCNQCYLIAPYFDKRVIWEKNCIIEVRTERGFCFWLVLIQEWLDTELILFLTFWDQWISGTRRFGNKEITEPSSKPFSVKFHIYLIADPLPEISFNVSYYYPGFNISAGNFYFDLLMPPIEESVFKSILIVIETYNGSQADFIPVLNQTYTGKEATENDKQNQNYLIVTKCCNAVKFFHNQNVLSIDNQLTVIVRSFFCN